MLTGVARVAGPCWSHATHGVLRLIPGIGVEEVRLHEACMPKQKVQRPLREHREELMLASLCECMLAGQSASSCDLSISVQGLPLDALELPQCRDAKGPCSDGNTSSSCPCNDHATLPAPRKLIKKASAYDQCSDPTTPILSVPIKRAFRQASGSDIVRDEPAIWSSGAEERQASATNVAKYFLYPTLTNTN